MGPPRFGVHPPTLVLVGPRNSYAHYTGCGHAARRLVISPLAALLQMWGALPGESAKTWLLARLGPRFLVSVWAVIFDAEGRVLLFRHTHDRAHPWGLPSGRLE